MYQRATCNLSQVLGSNAIKFLLKPFQPNCALTIVPECYTILGKAAESTFYNSFSNTGTVKFSFFPSD